MKDRALAAKRVLSVQKQLHRLEELKFAQLNHRMARLDQEQEELAGALAADDALHGLFVDMAVRRVMALRQERARLVPEHEARAKSLIKHTGRMKNAERLASALDLELRRHAERKELEQVLETVLATEDASLKQDP